MAYDPRTLEEFERLLENDESFVFISDWYWDSQVWVNGYHIGNTFIEGKWKTIQNGCTLGLTEESMYFAQFKDVRKGLLRSKAGYKEVSNHWSRPFQNFTGWQFNKNKTNKGKLTGYTFIFSANDGLPNSSVYNLDPAEGEKFQEVFLAGVGRYKAVTNSPDFAQQLSAIAQLHADGVLTSQEFKKAKDLFLGKSPDEIQQSERTLRSLKQLKDSGVLTAAEFATKKWDVISN